MGKAARIEEQERKLKLRRLQVAAHADPKSDAARRLRIAGGQQICSEVRGTYRQKALLLVDSEVRRAAVRDFGTRRQRRALMHASRIERHRKHRRGQLPTMVVIDDPYKKPMVVS